MLSRIQQAIEETQSHLNKALAYSVQFQKPEQIRYYRAFIAYLKAKARGVNVTPPKSNPEAWDDMNCVIEARAAKAAS